MGMKKSRVSVRIDGTFIAVVAAGAVAAVAWVKRREIAAGLQKINPASDQNVIYSGISRAGEAVTGKKGWSLGTWLYDVTHGNP